MFAVPPFFAKKYAFYWISLTGKKLTFLSTRIYFFGRGEEKEKKNFRFSGRFLAPKRKINATFKSLSKLIKNNKGIESVYDVGSQLPGAAGGTAAAERNVASNEL